MFWSGLKIIQIRMFRSVIVVVTESIGMMSPENITTWAIHADKMDRMLITADCASAIKETPCKNT